MSPPSNQQSPPSKPATPSTTLTTPDQSPGQDDDIWASDHDSTHHDTARHRDELLSDLPTLKRQHMTDGYREGLSVGKAKVMQQGFDDGYPIGVEIAMRAGRVIGVLEGWLASTSSSLSPAVAGKTGSSDDGGGGEGGDRGEVERLYERAKEELACKNLLNGLADEVVAGAKGVPDEVLVMLEKWEGRVFGVVERGERGREGKA